MSTNSVNNGRFVRLFTKADSLLYLKSVWIAREERKRDVSLHFPCLPVKKHLCWTLSKSIMIMMIIHCFVIASWFPILWPGVHLSRDYQKRHSLLISPVCSRYPVQTESLALSQPGIREGCCSELMEDEMTKEEGVLWWRWRAWQSDIKVNEKEKLSWLMDDKSEDENGKLLFKTWLCYLIVASEFDTLFTRRVSLRVAANWKTQQSIANT